MSLKTSKFRKNSVRSLKAIGLTVLWVCLWLPANLYGDSWVRTISLKAADQEQNIHIPVGASVTFLNNYPQKLYATSIIKEHTNKKLLSIESFEPGQSFELQFSKKGPYSICFSLNADSPNPICLPINVVPLQTASL